MSRKLKTMDGNTAAAHVAYAFTEVAAIYPITPSSAMAELVDQWSAEGRKNVFDQTVSVIEMQSEGGAAGAVHGSLVTGALTTTFTASQGLLLMIPNMYKIAGEMLPGVIHCSARALATHALSIFGDQSDVMACRATGFAELASSNPQEVMDLSAVAHLASIKGSVPFLHFFDGFRTSHEMQNIEAWDYDELRDMLDMDAVAAFRARANLPTHPVLRGSNQNPDIFFQIREASNPRYEALPDVVEKCMDEVNARIGTDYKPFNYYGAPDAEYVLVAMGSVTNTAEECVDWLNAHGEKTGLIKVRLYRPFCSDRFVQALPATVRRIAVLDRTKEPGAVCEPLCQDVINALFRKGLNIPVVGGRYGLGSKDTTPGAVISAFRNAQSENPVNNFTIGITDDVSNLSLPITEEPDTTSKGIISCKFWGLGSDGTVGANKNSIKIIGDHTDLNVQAYFQYDSKKSGGVTISHLRFGKGKIKSSYFVNKADFVACHTPSYIERFDIVQDIKPGGTFLLNCSWDESELALHIPAAAKKYLASNNIKFYTVDAISLAADLGLGGRTNTILQSAFFKLSGVLAVDDAVRYMKEAIVATYGHKGEKVVNMNFAAVDAGLDHVKEVTVPESWKNPEPDAPRTPAAASDPKLAKYVDEVMIPTNLMRGDTLPVSAFVDGADGILPPGTAAFEKRGIAVNVPNWIPENCIQCNQCSLVCPHAAIRPYAMTADEVSAAPEGIKTVKMIGKGAEDMSFSIIVSPLDCAGCGSCANVCPAKNKALVMKPLESMLPNQKYFDYAYSNVTEKEVPFAASTVKGSQFKKPLLEFSGACAGCGETPYAKLLTQLFGDRMTIANATGCTSIWGGAAPSTPYTTNKDGHGPAWNNSLFEDNAEFGLGMLQAVKQRRAKLADTVKKLVAVDYCCADLKAAGEAWLEAMDDGEASKTTGKALLSACEEAIDVDLTGTQWEAEWIANGKVCPCEACTLAREVLSQSDLVVKPSFWCFGGDGWAYDIGYGGLDHVIASGENINIFVFDTEVYSNTGGQSSKATPLGAVAQFAAAGKSIKNKELAQMAMTYGYVYVAQISMGADYNQTIKAMMEAEAYNGPSLIIAYAPCINHGSTLGMGKAMTSAKNAVQAGYWNLFRYNPALAAEGKNPFTLDSKDPTGSYRDFIMGEVRYSSLTLSFPERAEELFTKAEENAKERHEYLKSRS
ncbi:MAG: pyruvate:ferredoxin (flavodoxin) oxidoreductase [Clostridiales bacterium]|nr:pyruvate:ferredoxin (flavodoxin) oxidoreductase [Clostridiales bacterium]